MKHGFQLQYSILKLRVIHDHNKSRSHAKYQSRHSPTALASIVCRYLVASSPDTIYVSFIGTKLAKDVLVDANFFHKPLWKTEKAEQVRRYGGREGQ